eukprot:15458097-Alexandrium_andersonii.AAC.1
MPSPRFHALPWGFPSSSRALLRMFCVAIGFPMLPLLSCVLLVPLSSPLRVDGAPSALVVGTPISVGPVEPTVR